MDMSGWGLTGRAASRRLGGRDQEGDLGLRFLNTPGVKVERCSLGQYIG